MKKIIKKNIIIEKGQNHAQMTIISDVHYGSKTFDEKLFGEVIKWCLDNQVVVMTNGDLIECPTKSAPDMFNVSVGSINDQMDFIVDVFGELAESGLLIGLLEGNHERRIKRHANLDVTQIMAKDLNVPYGRKGIFLYLKARNENQKKSQLYTMYGLHGSSGAYTTGGKVNSVERLVYSAEADLYFIGHSHGLMPSKIPRFKVDRGRVKQVDTHFVVTGSYMGYWGSYAQEKGYTPQALGSPKIKLHTEKHRISVSV
jgi:hypothetical protein